MANSSSEDETDTLPERPTRIQPYQFQPGRQNFERVPEHRVSFEARKSARLNCINLIHFRLTAGRLRGCSCIVIPGFVCELLQIAATQ